MTGSPAGRARCARGGRSHALLTCVGGIGCIGPPVGRDCFLPTNGKTHADHPCKTGLWIGRGDDAAGDAVAGVAGGVRLHIVGLLVDDDSGAAVGDDAVG